MQSVQIVDYGIGNVGSMLNMCRKIGKDVKITNDPDDIKTASHLILPGVGAFDAGIELIQSRGYLPALDIAAKEGKIPILGVCLGAQLMLESSEEGALPGLGWIKGKARKFDTSKGVKVPHMGWNSLIETDRSSLFSNMPDDPARFYFVHSYHFDLANDADATSFAHHGELFAASFQHENIYGVQFHPEKSHLFGMKLLENFLSIG